MVALVASSLIETWWYYVVPGIHRIFKYQAKETSCRLTTKIIVADTLHLVTNVLWKYRKVLMTRGKRKRRFIWGEIWKRRSLQWYTSEDLQYRSWASYQIPIKDAYCLRLKTLQITRTNQEMKKECCLCKSLPITIKTAVFLLYKTRYISGHSIKILHRQTSNDRQRIVNLPQKRRFCPPPTQG